MVSRSNDSNGGDEGAEEEELRPLFETTRVKGGGRYRAFAATVWAGICLIWVYRATHRPPSAADAAGGDGGAIGGMWGYWGWVGLLGSEMWFGLYWILTQAARWTRVSRATFPRRLSLRYEDELPTVDIFVCTADPEIEPPMMVINTVLSVMAYDYPPEKLSVHLSDDGGSNITFYALLEASSFSKHWIPYCRKFKVEPRSPAAHFASISDHCDTNQAKDLVSIKKLYEDMENRIETSAKLGRISEEVRSKHRGFSQWDSFSSRSDHDTILQFIIDGRDPEATDTQGRTLPTLVYLAREKRPQHPHNYKAGAMNALIRVSSQISNGQIILNVDCDMYSNNSQSVRDALCFLMDEGKGHEIAFVQFPQNFENITKNDIYSNSLRVIAEVDFHGLDGIGGPLYVGTGCFHRRDVLCGLQFNGEKRDKWNKANTWKVKASASELEESLKCLASCTYERNTQWGNEIGLKYGCPVEDVITGLFIQCQGWKSVYFNPEREGFLGVAATTLAQTLVQHKRWSEGDLQIFLSKYNPVCFGHGRISPLLQMGYCTYCFWALNCFPTLYYSTIPSLYLLKGIPLFPEVSSPWFLPFAYVIVSSYGYSLVEFLWSGGTILGWWNDQRIWLYKRTSSYLFACIDTVLMLLGFSNSEFIISAKVAEEDILWRYEREIMEFGIPSPMFTVLATLALLNLFCLLGVVKKVVMDGGIAVYGTMVLQILLCGFLVLINLPLYQGLFFRKDKGKMPPSIAVKSVVFALVVCTSFAFLY